MLKIADGEALIKAHESFSKSLDEKFHAEDGKKAIVVCGGTGCLSSNKSSTTSTN